MRSRAGILHGHSHSYSRGFTFHCRGIQLHYQQRRFKRDPSIKMKLIDRILQHVPLMEKDLSRLPESALTDLIRVLDEKERKITLLTHEVMRYELGIGSRDKHDRDLDFDFDDRDPDNP